MKLVLALDDVARLQNRRAILRRDLKDAAIETSPAIRWTGQKAIYVGEVANNLSR